VTPAVLADLVRSVAHGVLADRGLDPSALPDTVTVHRPRDPRHGDYATNVALQTGKKVGVPPRDLAEWLAEELSQRPGVRTVDVAGPGFVNLWLGADAHGEILTQVLVGGKRFGSGQQLAGCRISIDLLPATRSGPLHLAGARQVAVADALDRILTFAGAVVTREQARGDAANDGRTPGCDVSIHVLGAGSGNAGQPMTVAAARSADSTTVEVLAGQQVSLVQRVARRPLTQRRTTIVDMVEAIGLDATRYALVRSAFSSPLDIDLDVWSKRTDDNPIFVIQYAHARLASLARNAADLGISCSDARLALLGHHREGELIRTLVDLPRVVAQAAVLREPHRVARYLEQLVGAYHSFSAACPVLPLGDERPGPLHAARLVLCEATRQVLVNGLDLLGVSAPERL
jgi:arginyl-tRNA synthetase